MAKRLFDQAKKQESVKAKQEELVEAKQAQSAMVAHLGVAVAGMAALGVYALVSAFRSSSWVEAGNVMYCSVDLMCCCVNRIQAYARSVDERVEEARQAFDGNKHVSMGSTVI